MGLLKKLEDVSAGCDQRMMRYKAEITCLFNEEVARFGLKEFSVVLRMMRLR